MARQWTDQIVQRHQLRVYADASMNGPNWRGLFSQAISEFNQLSSQKSLGVTLLATSQAPAPSGRGGADVSVSAANGEITLPYEGSRPVQFDGERLHGLTRQVHDPDINRIIKCHVFVPTNPQVQMPRGKRLVGPGVRMTILVHELVHCCGLSNSEHTNSGDLFIANPSVLLGSNGAAGDRVDLGTYGDDNLPQGMPPLVMLERTAQHIRRLWPTSSRRPNTGARKATLAGPPRGTQFASVDHTARSTRERRAFDRARSPQQPGRRVS